MRLPGKVAIVTGAGSGFGQGIAERFAQEGAQVVVADVNESAGKAVVAGIEQLGGTVIYVRADVAQAFDVEAMIHTAVQRFGGLHILVNNAGIPQRPCPLVDTSEELFDRLFAVNVKSVYLGARFAIPVFRSQGTGGVIINTASTAGLRPRPGLTAYNATKGAVITLTKSLALEVASDRIRVNALCPVAGDTPMLAEFMGGTDTPEARARFLQTIPLGRFSRPSDMAAAALYLASDEAEFITGVCLEVDGGRCI